MYRIRRLSLIAILIAVLVSCAGCQEDFSAYQRFTTEQRLEDFGYMYKVFEENYPYFGVAKRRYNIDWLSKEEEYKEMIYNCENDAEFLKTIAQIIDEVKISHTYVFPMTYRSQFASAYRALESLKKPYLDALCNEVTLENESYWIDIEKKLNQKKNNSRVTSAGSAEKNLTTRIIEDGRIAYLSIRSFFHSYVDQDSEAIHDFLSSIIDYPYLIVDIRGNGGGSSLYWIDHIVSSLLQKPCTIKTYAVFRGGELIKSYSTSSTGESSADRQKILKNVVTESSERNISDLRSLSNTPEEVFSDFSYCYEATVTVKPDDSEGFEGSVFLLVDDKVFSAANDFAQFAKWGRWATLIGTPTKGGEDGMEAGYLPLPNSGLMIRIPLGMGLNPDGSINSEYGTVPDILINDDEDAFEKALELIQSQ